MNPYPPPSPPRASLRRSRCGSKLAILAFVLGSGAAHRAAADWTDDYIRGLMQSNGIPAVAVAVITNGVVAKAQGYGAGITTDTVFQLDSVTKQFTATAVMQLIGEGRLATNQFVSTILTNAPPTWQGITIAHLLSHTAGVTDTLNRGPMGGPWQQNEDPFPFLSHIFDAPLVSSNSGSCYLYSDFGYYTLGAVVEKVSGRRFSEVLQTQIFGPAGMTRSEVLNPDRLPPGRVRGHDDQGVVDPKTAKPVFSGGAIQTSLNDMIAWDKALREQTVLDQTALHQMWTPWDRPACGQPNGPPVHYGFGWSINLLRDGGRLVHHNGGGFGYATAIYRWLDTDVTVIVLTNKQAGKSGWQPGPDAVARVIYAHRRW